MLVLSRKEGEKIMIGENIVVIVARLDRRDVRLGIEAPPDVRVMRSELLGHKGGRRKDEGSRKDAKTQRSEPL